MIKKIADGLNLFCVLFAIFVVIPTWFEPMDAYNGVAVSFMLVVMSAQVVALRLQHRN